MADDYKLTPDEYILELEQKLADYRERVVKDGASCGDEDVVLAALERLEECEAALRRWGLWAHSPQNVAQSDNLFCDAVEGTPEKYFPDEPGLERDLEEHQLSELLVSDDSGVWTWVRYEDKPAVELRHESGLWFSWSDVILWDPENAGIWKPTAKAMLEALEGGATGQHMLEVEMQDKQLRRIIAVKVEG